MRVTNELDSIPTKAIAPPTKAVFRMPRRSARILAMGDIRKFDPMKMEPTQAEKKDKDKSQIEFKNLNNIRMANGKQMKCD